MYAGKYAAGLLKSLEKAHGLRLPIHLLVASPGFTVSSSQEGELKHKGTKRKDYLTLRSITGKTDSNIIPFVISQPFVISTDILATHWKGQ